MKAGHYLKWAEKSFKILNKFHSRMFELGGEESDLWNDDLNCRFYDLERSLDDDNYDRLGYDRNGYFYQLQKLMNALKVMIIKSYIILMKSGTLKIKSKGLKKES